MVSSGFMVVVIFCKFIVVDMKVSVKWFGDDEVIVIILNDLFCFDEELESYFVIIIVLYLWYCFICVNGELVGVIYLLMGVKVYVVCVDLSYILVKEYWGKGVVMEVSKLVVKVGFEEFYLVCM